jgi:hypothetical protein
VPRRVTRMRFARDPVSELFDGAARRLLARAYARPGVWVAGRIPDPTGAHRSYLSGRGIDPAARDTAGVTLDARTRWARGFVRALQYQHRWFSGSPDGGGWRDRKRARPRQDMGLSVQVGRALAGGRQAGTLLRPGRAVRIQVRPGAKRWVRAHLDGDERWDVSESARSDPADRDWS